MLANDTVESILLIIASLVEFSITLAHGPRRKVVSDSLTNFSLGIGTVLIGLLEKGMALGVYSIFYAWSFIHFPQSPWLWLAAFLACDFVHYLYHWLGHRTKIFWAAHVAHHSSIHFNLSIGFRVNFFHLLYRFIFWAPLCLLGIPPQLILFFESITAIHNFLIHTERIGKLGVLDLVFNTPSNHRVHHASNPEYIDKNLGGILMLYDHLFGTFRREERPPVYGITHNIHTHNPLKILSHEYIRLTRELSGIKGLKAKLRYLVSPPK